MTGTRRKTSLADNIMEDTTTPEEGVNTKSAKENRPTMPGDDNNNGGDEDRKEANESSLETNTEKIKGTPVKEQAVASGEEPKASILELAVTDEAKADDPDDSTKSNDSAEKSLPVNVENRDLAEGEEALSNDTTTGEDAPKIEGSDGLENPLEETTFDENEGDTELGRDKKQEGQDCNMEGEEKEDAPEDTQEASPKKDEVDTKMEVDDDKNVEITKIAEDQEESNEKPDMKEVELENVKVGNPGATKGKEDTKMQDAEPKPPEEPKTKAVEEEIADLRVVTEEEEKLAGSVEVDVPIVQSGESKNDTDTKGEANANEHKASPIKEEDPSSESQSEAQNAGASAEENTVEESKKNSADEDAKDDTKGNDAEDAEMEDCIEGKENTADIAKNACDQEFQKKEMKVADQQDTEMEEADADEAKEGSITMEVGKEEARTEANIANAEPESERRPNHANHAELEKVESGNGDKLAATANPNEIQEDTVAGNKGENSENEEARALDANTPPPGDNDQETSSGGEEMEDNKESENENESTSGYETANTSPEKAHDDNPAKEKIANKDDSKGMNNDDEEGSPTNKPIPLHKLMVDYKEREENRKNENRKNARKSPRPKKRPDSFEAGPACIFLDPEKQKEKKKLRLEMRRQMKLNRRRAKANQALENGKNPTMNQVDDTKGAQGSPTSPDKPHLDSDPHDPPSDVPDTIPSRQEPTEAEMPPEKVPSAPSQPRTSTTDSDKAEINADPSNSPQSKIVKNLTKRSSTIQRLCQGHKFPVQLMLLIKSKIAKEAIWWSTARDGTTFVIDCAWFQDSIMKKYFPGNPYKSITTSLSRWGFKRDPLDLPNGMLAFYHPQFQRERPEFASDITLPGEGAENQEQKQSMPTVRREISTARPVHNYPNLARPPTGSDRPSQLPTPNPKRVGHVRDQAGPPNFAFQREKYVGRQQPVQRVEHELPPSVRIANLRDGRASAQEKAAQEKAAVKQKTSSPPENAMLPSAQPASRSVPPRSREPGGVVDLTEEDEEGRSMDQAKIWVSKGYYDRARAFLPPSYALPAALRGDKRKLDEYKKGPDHLSGAPNPSLFPDQSYYTEAARLYQRSQENRMVSGEEMKGMDQGRTQRQAYEEERGMRMHRQATGNDNYKLRAQQQAEEERALRMQQEAIQRQRAMLAAQDEEYERRRRLSTALYGSNRPAKKIKTEAEPTPAAAPAPSPILCRDPPSNEAEGTSAPEPASPSGRRPEPGLSPVQQPQQQQQHRPSLIDSIRVPAVNPPSIPQLLGGVPGFNPYLAPPNLALMNGFYNPAGFAAAASLLSSTMGAATMGAATMGATAMGAADPSLDPLAMYRNFPAPR